MSKTSGWVGAGVLTAGVSAAMFAGAGAANADSDDGPDSGPANVSSAPEKDSPSDDAPGQKLRSAIAKHAKAAESRRERRAEQRERAATERKARRSAQKAAEDAPAAETVDDQVTPKPSSTRLSTPATPKVPNPLAALGREIERQVTSLTTTRTSDVPVASQAAEQKPSALIERGISDDFTPTRDIPIIGDILGPYQPDYPPLVRAVGSAVFNVIGAIVQTADGPPVVPPELRDEITVSSSKLEVAPGNEVDADWYYPTSGQQPERLIYLQHGILASGPMYSYTAAYLAERTNSVVVVTTVTSNPFADDGMWLGGDNMHKAVAQLFLDDERTALNASLDEAALKTGDADLLVPKEFVLVGHSLGGGFAPGVAGHYAEGLVNRRGTDGNPAGLDEENHLRGVVVLDAVPFYPILPNAMDRLATLEESGDADDYVPIYEIGAPFNYLNSLSDIDDELADARPGKFNGVVIDGGVHMDGMLGGNPLIQTAAYLVAGWPQPQNPPAVQLLMAGWINDMFEGNIDPATGYCSTSCEGVYGAPGDSVVIEQPGRDATAVVIDSGSPSAVEWLLASSRRLIPIAV